MKPFTCNRCKHSWYARFFLADGQPITPQNCPKSKSPYWNKPRRAKKEGSEKDAAK